MWKNGCGSTDEMKGRGRMLEQARMNETFLKHERTSSRCVDALANWTKHVQVSADEF